MGKNLKRLALGVDRGGTTTRLALVDGRGGIVKRASFPTVHIRRLPAVIMRTAAAWKLDAGVPAVIATRGAMTRKWKKPYLLNKLKGRLNLLDVISDAEAAYLAAHGRGGGALLIAGTGSVAFLKEDGGGFRKFGGHGPPGGDPGSGLWLGSRFLKLSAGRKPAGRRARAAYAVTAVKKAEKGDPAAAALVREARERLCALLAGAAAARRRPGAPLRTALSGGLLRNAFFRRGFTALARERLAPVRLSFASLRRPAESAAALLALEMHHGRA